MTAPPLYLAVGLLSIGAGFLTATIGFGGAVFLMQFLPLLLPFLNASSLSSIIVYAGILVLAWQYRGHVMWREVWLPSLLYVLSGVPAVFFTGTLDAQRLELCFAVFLVILGLYNLCNILKSGGIRLPRGHAVTAACSVLSGIGTGMFGIGGPPMALYFLSVAGDDRKAYIGTLQVFFAISMSFTISARFISGAMPVNLVPLALLGMGTSLIGKHLGARLAARINVNSMKLCVCLFMVFSGAAAIAGCV